MSRFTVDTAAKPSTMPPTHPCDNSSIAPINAGLATIRLLLERLESNSDTFKSQFNTIVIALLVLSMLVVCTLTYFVYATRPRVAIDARDSASNEVEKDDDNREYEPRDNDYDSTNDEEYIEPLDSI